MNKRFLLTDSVADENLDSFCYIFNHLVVFQCHVEVAKSIFLTVFFHCPNPGIGFRLCLSNKVRIAAVHLTGMLADSTVSTKNEFKVLSIV